MDVTEEEVRFTFKRLDIDRDSRVTFSEFKRLFSSNFNSPSSSNGFNVAQTAAGCHRQVLGLPVGDLRDV